MLEFNNTTRLAVIGASGTVGVKISMVLKERLPLGFVFDEKNLILVASPNSVGKTIENNSLFGNRKIMGIQEALTHVPQFVLMSAGSEVSRFWAPLFAKMKLVVIDNSSAWRMDDNVPLVVPGISPWKFNPEQCLIANPNCVAIMLAHGIAPFLKEFGNLKRVKANVAQAVSGAGHKGIMAYTCEKGGLPDAVKSPFVGQIYNNILPATYLRGITGYNEEEMKVAEELPKIFGRPDFKISSTNSRAPVLHGHSAHIEIDLDKDVNIYDIIELFKKAHNVVYSDTPIGPIDVIGKDYAMVCSVRKNLHDPNIVEFFITSDNLRMGAASNAVSILEMVMQDDETMKHLQIK